MYGNFLFKFLIHHFSYSDLPSLFFYNGRNNTCINPYGTKVAMNMKHYVIIVIMLLVMIKKRWLR